MIPYPYIEDSGLEPVMDWISYQEGMSDTRPPYEVGLMLAPSTLPVQTGHITIFEKDGDEYGVITDYGNTFYLTEEGLDKNYVVMGVCGSSVANHIKYQMNNLAKFLGERGEL